MSFVLVATVAMLLVAAGCFCAGLLVSRLFRQWQLQASWYAGQRSAFREVARYASEQEGRVSVLQVRAYCEAKVSL